MPAGRAAVPDVPRRRHEEIAHCRGPYQSTNYPPQGIFLQQNGDWLVIGDFRQHAYRLCRVPTDTTLLFEPAGVEI